MLFNKIKPDGIEVYLEGRRTRQFVGLLSKDKDNNFIFKYDLEYLKSSWSIPLGPEMPFSKKNYKSPTLFVPFEDRFPSRENAAYPDYCAYADISVTELDPFTLLCTIAKRGPSSFVFEAHYADYFTANDLLNFRNNLGLTVREFARCFDLSHAAITRVERGQSSGRELLKRVAIYVKYPQVLADALKKHGGIVPIYKREQVEKFLNSQC